VTTKVKYEDIKFVNEEIQKLFKGDYKDFNDWERTFLTDMNGLIQLETPLSEKQIYQLYKAYFKHIEGDESEAEDWAREHGLIHLYRPR